jgi:hypothetical protein
MRSTERPTQRIMPILVILEYIRDTNIPIDQRVENGQWVENGVQNAKFL